MTTFCIRNDYRNGFGSLFDDERGVSITEGVIVIPFFVLIWMGLIFLHNSYVGAVEAQVQAQNLAFQGAAAGNCTGSTEDEGANQDVDDALNGANSESEVGGTTLNTDVLINECGGSSLLDWSHHRIGATVEVSGIPTPFGGPSNTLKGSAKLMCNTEPRDGLGDMIYGFLQDIF